MNIEVENRVKFKLFVGIQISAELRLLLNLSHEWKQAKITSPKGDDLIEAHYHDKDYIGLFLSSEKTCVNELKLIELQIFQKLKNYCPKFSSEKIKILVFSQVFVS